MKSLLLATAAFVGVTSFGYGSSGSDGVSEGEERPAKRIKVEGPNAPLSQIGQSVFSGIKNDNVIEKILGMVRSKDRKTLRTVNRATVYDVDRLGPVNIKLLGKPEDLEMIFIHGWDGQGGLRNKVTIKSELTSFLELSHEDQQRLLPFMNINAELTDFLELSDEDQQRILPFTNLTKVNTKNWAALTGRQKDRLRGHVVKYERFEDDPETPVSILESFENLTSLKISLWIVGGDIAVGNSLLETFVASQHFQGFIRQDLDSADTENYNGTELGCSLKIKCSLERFLNFSDELKMRLPPFMELYYVRSYSWSQLTDDLKIRLRHHVTEYHMHYQDQESPSQILEYFSNLFRLELEGISIRDEGAKSLAGLTSLNKLTVLELPVNEIGVDGAKALAASPYIQNLVTLDLDYNDITDEGAMALANSPYVSKVEKLMVYNLGEEGIWALANSPNLPKLRKFKIRLESEDFTHEDAESLMRALEGNKTIETLVLYSCNCTDVVWETLEKWADLKKIDLCSQG